MARSKRAPTIGPTTALLPAPVGGWNARDSLGAMEALDAVQLLNFFPDLTSVTVRFGHSRYATGIIGQVESLFAYSGSTTNKLFAVAAGSIYDVTAGGAAGAASVTSLSNSRWQYVNIATPAGTFIIAVNGADSPYSFDGATWANPSITGVTATSLIHVNEHKNRLWFIENGTLKAYYLPVQSIAGAVGTLDLSSFCTRGGYLMAMGTWTIDAGYGVDDYAVFITSNGEVLVYRGTDPSSATTWALAGVYWIGSPIGRRCFVKYRGDLVVITQDGLVALSSALEASRLNPKAALSNKIQSQISNATSTYSSNYGWQTIAFPKENMLLLNVPIQQGNIQEQYVMNTLSGAWCQFQGWYANCWELFNDHIYYGSNTFVGKAWDTNSDNGTSITTAGFQAFNDFGIPVGKQFTMMRPTFLTNGQPSIQGDIKTDFDLSAPSPNLSTAPIAGALWDAATWDSSLWADTLVTSRLWQGTSGIGKYGAPRISSMSLGIELEWVNTEIVYKQGGVLV